VDTPGEKDDKAEPDRKGPSVRVVDRRWWARGETVEADESGLRKPTYLEDLEQRLGDATAQLQRVMNEHRRSLEEFEQVKARLRRDVSRDVERARRGVIADLLEVLDNLDRALAAAGPSDDANGLRRGVQLVRDQFLSKIEAFGVMRLAALGQPFDAQKHEAVSIVSVDDPAKDGLVVAVVKEGYAVGDEMLRPASVVVGKI
jgi:molecular chaperone GrpE